MKFGLLFRPQDPPDAAHMAQRWQEILTATQAAEQAGFGWLFLSEHHMMLPTVTCRRRGRRSARWPR